jgi:hypothetical protein
MNDDFEIPVQYKGEERVFTGRLQPFGYSYRLIVDVNGTEIWFEPDEERNLRALTDVFNNEQKQVDPMLLKAIGAALQAILQ